ncbi:FimV C-terminal domain-containing protein [Thiothrix caldifontis]|uniref:FimV C-terminal domain-containing protein n=1 Tax=Thiothrix caldifontis TaxID=525918 RepID=A0A1H3X3V1_9GAMM|nr:FimV/HubP family polar landmark protein [Thiothrix caldifontis]SDZ93661.1 FimV C-terminal domain-containing protein [Thiothrix caldifontis]
MKKLTPLHQQVRLHVLQVLVPVSLAGMCLSGAVLAADKVWEIQPGNSLGKIIAEHYPDYGSRQAIMQEVLKRNPQAFRNQNVNSLIVGETLQLPDPADIPNLKPLVPKAEVAGGDPAAQKKIQALETQVAELEETITILEEENAAVQEMLQEQISGGTKPEPAAPIDNTLPQQLDATKQALEESKAANVTLETQVATLTRENEALQNDLQQIRAAAAVAETKAASVSNLPWILLGLLALLTLPLIWLMWRKHESSSLDAGAISASTLVAPAETLADVPIQSHPEVPVVATIAMDENPDAALKLDIARAYLDLRDSEAAADILQDVLVEGGNQQRQEAREILSFIT